MAKQQLTIEYVPISKLKLNPKNPRKNDDNVQAVVKSMAAFGWTNPILARRANGMVIAGHTRLKAAMAEGLKQVPVVYLDLDENDADVYMVADNKMVENSPWDFPKLADLLVEFDQLDVDLLLTGFSKAEVDGLMLGPSGNTDFLLPDGEKEGFEQMTFTLSTEQAITVKGAVGVAKALGDFTDTGNENHNGNALARICESYNG